ncbi:MAG: penicillin-binding protein 2 [Magnetococcales bacterium]|nr:penicillin-binding protein 2 [Magnetococcales bacterium]NGZ25339.1 penicillin-binding protein 2 [Magnetococcales bacterium]
MLEDDREQFKVDARRRLFLLGGVQTLLLSAVGFRLFYLQLLKGGTYHDLAENNRINFQPIPAPRGLIYDRYGEILVENRPDYRIQIIPELAGPLPPLLNRLQQLLGIEDKEIQQVLKQAKRQRSFLPLKVKSHLEWEELSSLESRIHTFPGTTIQVQSLRHYPYDSLSAHVMGYLGDASDGDREVFKNEIIFRSGDLVGKSGLERRYETRLRGKEGIQEMEVNALGRIVRELRRTPPQSGEDLTLTLDIDLQKAAENSLGERPGAVVVMNPNTGEVLAMVSYPSYNPNEFIRGITNKQWKELTSHPDKPLNNKAVQGHYPPGSTFKMVVALAAMHEGVLSPSDTVFCPGFVERQNHTYHCWKRGGHGTVGVVQAIAQSCDVFFYKIAERLGVDAIERMAKYMGLGERTGIGLEGERPGLIPTKAWKRSAMNTVWYPGETLVTSIGQGYVLATPLQLACMVSTIANGGSYYQPILVRPPPGETVVPKKQFNFNPNLLGYVKTGMEEVLHGPRGTAKATSPKLVRAAGKTGTSQVVRVRRTESGKAINPNERRFQDHALFVCYAPVSNPELSISVIVEHGGHGSSAAAPVATRILDYYFARKEKSAGVQS